jgi:cell cycle sensor histidine kinase DivJ
VALHGGDVTIRSRVGEGTRITVRMPLDCEQTRPQAKTATRTATNPATKPMTMKLPPRAPAESGAAVAARDNATVVKKSA